MTKSLAAALLALLTCSAFAETPLSFIGEPESFANDAAAKKADLAYRVSARPSKWAPATMKLYITFGKQLPSGEMQMRGRLVFVGIKDGTEDQRLTRETSLSQTQVVALLRCIQEQEIFSLQQPPLFTPESVALPPDRGRDPTRWCFERFQAKALPSSPVPAGYSVFWHVSCDHGPAQVVFSAFSRHALKLLPSPKHNEPRN